MVDCLVFSMCYFRLCKNDVYKLLLDEEMDYGGNRREKMFLKLRQCRIIWYLFAGFKPIILCSVHSIKFLIYVLTAKIWFVETSTLIMKYETRVVNRTLSIIVVVIKFQSGYFNMTSNCGKFWIELTDG